MLLVAGFEGFSQKLYFIYLQSETEQPFFVRMNDKTFNATASGYLILPQLKDSSYQLKVGFPQNKWNEQVFSVDIKSKDRGYLLKNFGEKGWGLFDLQTMGVQMSVNSGNEKATNMETIQVSTFTEILAKAANDPSLKEKPVFAVARQEEKKVHPPAIEKETVAFAAQPLNEAKDSTKNEETPKPDIKSSAAINPEKATDIKEVNAEPITKVKEEAPPAAKEEIVQKDVAPAIISKDTMADKQEAKAVVLQEYKKSVVVKKSESSTTEGFGLSYVDQYPDGHKDTIQIIIPNPPGSLVKTDEQAQPADEKRFLDITDQSKERKVVVKNIDHSCSATASESEFLRLRRKMAGQKTEEAMINEARKAFKAKCFTIVHIKNLGNLFLNEAGKFQFYEAAYPYSSDRNNFTALQSELKENYFIHRFKNLVKASDNL